MQEPVYEELVREFFATFHFDTAEARNDVGRNTVHFRLGVSIGYARLLSLVGDLGCTINMRLFRQGL